MVDSTYEFQVDPAVPKLRKTKEFVQGGPAPAEFGSKLLEDALGDKAQAYKIYWYNQH